MRVVIVRRSPGISYSMDIYADQLVARLSKVRPDWEIVTNAPQLSNQDWHSGNKLDKYYRRYWQHPRSLHRLSADIFHIIDHTSGHVAYPLKQRRQNVIITCHDIVPLVCPETLKQESRFPALSRATWNYSAKGMSVADHVIAVSAHTAKDIQAHFPIATHQISVVPMAADEAFQPLTTALIQPFRQRYLKDPKTICLLHVGTNHHRKNLTTVLQVLLALKNQGIPAVLWRVGGSFTPAQQAWITKFNLDSAIVQFEKIDDTQLRLIYNAADVLLMPSLYEGFGLPALEAMKCGTPVIASHASSLPEVVGDAAILVHPTDVTAITQAVIQLSEDPHLREKLHQQGIQRGQQFSWTATAEATAAIYEQVLQR